MCKFKFKGCGEGKVKSKAVPLRAMEVHRSRSVALFVVDIGA